MRRMIPDPEKVIKCSWKNVGRNSIIYVPIKNVDELPITFDLITSNSVSSIGQIYAFYSDLNGEVYGGGSFLIPGDGKGDINVYVNADSLIRNEYPYLTIELSYVRGDVQSAPLTDNALVFVINIIHLEKGVIDII